MASYFRTMIEEKGLLDNKIKVEVKGVTHFMEVIQIIQLIENTSNGEQKTIKDTFCKIDFQNGDLMHYITFLARAFILNNYAI